MSSKQSHSRRPSKESITSRSSSFASVSRRTSSPSNSARSSVSSASQTGYANFKRSREVFQQLVKILQHDTHYLDALEGSIAKALETESTLKKPTSCICLALGAVNRWEDERQIWESTVGLAQLIVLITVLDAFGIDRSRTTVADPRFREGDTLFLKSLGFSASTSAFGTEAKPNLPELKETTLVYNPGCSNAQLYQRNWSPEGLSRIITLQGTDRVLHQAVGNHADFRIGGQRARVTASTSNNENPRFIAAIEESVSKAQEPLRRALSISEENRLPSIYDYVKEGIKVNKLASHFRAIDARAVQYAVGQTHTLCWASEALLKRMPLAFWRITKMVAKVSGNITVDLTIDK